MVWVKSLALQNIQTKSKNTKMWKCEFLKAVWHQDGGDSNNPGLELGPTCSNAKMVLDDASSPGSNLTLGFPRVSPSGRRRWGTKTEFEVQPSLQTYQQEGRAPGKTPHLSACSWIFKKHTKFQREFWMSQTKAAQDGWFGAPGSHLWSSFPNHRNLNCHFGTPCVLWNMILNPLN